MRGCRSRGWSTRLAFHWAIVYDRRRAHAQNDVSASGSHRLFQFHWPACDETGMPVIFSNIFTRTYSTMRRRCPGSG